MVTDLKTVRKEISDTLDLLEKMSKQGMDIRVETSYLLTLIERYGHMREEFGMAKNHA